MKILLQRLQDKIQRRLFLNISSEVLYTGGKIQIEKRNKIYGQGFLNQFLEGEKMVILPEMGFREDCHMIQLVKGRLFVHYF